MRPQPHTTRTLRRATAESLAVDAMTVEAARALRAKGVDFLLLKGPALRDLLYDPGEERSYGDADLLVEPGTEGAATAALSEIGFEVRFPDAATREAVPHETQLVRSAGSAGTELVEIHTGFDGVHDPGAMWRSLLGGRDRVEIFGDEMEVPSVPARLAIAALHAGSHGAGQTRSRRDVERAVSRFGESDWRRAWELASAWGAEDLFVVGLDLAPDGPSLRAALGIAHSPSAGARLRGRGMPRAQRSLEQLARARGPAAKGRLVVRKTFPSREAMIAWKPVAARGRAGLAIGYLWRPFWLAARVPEAAWSYLRERRRLKSWES